MDVIDMRKLVEKSKCILLDIEGTTTSIDFVKKELFPYAEKYMEEYVKKHWNEDHMNEILDLLIRDQVLLNQDDQFVSLPPVPSNEIEQFQDRVISHLRWQIAHDCKTTGLKKIQGYIWKSGYATGLLRGHIYEDVPVALQNWKTSGKKIYIFSSGSVEAQKLLFCNSIIGDLDKFIDGNFDTSIGSKIEPESYSEIAKLIGESTENIIFFTDRPKEAVAAKNCGMKVILMIRECNNPFLKLEEQQLGQEDGRLTSFTPILTQD